MIPLQQIKSIISLKCFVVTGIQLIVHGNDRKALVHKSLSDFIIHGVCVAPDADRDNDSRQEKDRKQCDLKQLMVKFFLCFILFHRQSSFL